MVESLIDIKEPTVNKVHVVKFNIMQIHDPVQS